MMCTLVAHREGSGYNKTRENIMGTRPLCITLVKQKCIQRLQGQKLGLL